MDDLSDGRLSFTEIYAYLPCGRYPTGYSKRVKPVLRGTPFAQKTCFGWVLAGLLQSKGPRPAAYTCCLPAENDSLRKFCEIEDNSMKQPVLSPGKRTVVKHHEPSYSKDNHGRFGVPLPRKFGGKALRKSRTQQEERLNRLQRSLRIRNRAVSAGSMLAPNMAKWDNM